MSPQRKPTDEEREHLNWIMDQVASIQRLLDDVPHAIAMKIIRLTSEIENVAFDPYGGYFSSCEHCELPILDTDDFESGEDEGWFHRACADQIRKSADHPYASITEAQPND